MFDLPSDLSATIEAIHGTSHRLVYVFAGAGALALHWLHSVPGSSRTVLEARDCYAPRSLADVVGAPTVQAVSAATARSMADWAATRAAALVEPDVAAAAGGGWLLLGVSCTAAIATDRARRGADRAFVAVQGAAPPLVYALTLRAVGAPPSPRDRAGQEALVSRLVILAVAGACGLGEVPLPLEPGETLVVHG